MLSFSLKISVNSAVLSSYLLNSSFVYFFSTVDLAEEPTVFLGVKAGEVKLVVSFLDPLSVSLDLPLCEESLDFTSEVLGVDSLAVVNFQLLSS